MELKALKFADGVVRTTETDVVIEKLDYYFVRANHSALITSVLRTPEKQLEIIQSLARKHDVIKPDVVLDMETMFAAGSEIGTVPMWQYAWSLLLHLGVIVNPPVRAKVLSDYWRDGINKKGMFINPSEHFYGTAFDIGGSENGAQDEYDIVKSAEKDSIGIRYVLLERKNNAVHVAVI